MAWLADKLGSGPLLPEGSSAFFARRVSELAGVGLIACAGLYGAALISYAPIDPSLNAAADGPVLNWLGRPGATVADVMVQTFGLLAALPGVVAAAWGQLLVRKLGVGQLWLRTVLMLSSLLLLTTAGAILQPFDGWPLAAGLGGVAGQVLLERVASAVAFLNVAHIDIITVIVAAVLALPGVAALLWSLALPASDWKAMGRGVVFVNHKAGEGLLWALRRVRRPAVNDSLFDDDDEEEEQETAITPRRRTPRAAAKPKAKPKTAGLVESKTQRLKAGRRTEAQRQQTLDLGADDGGYIAPQIGRAHV